MSLVLRNLDTNSEISVSKETPLIIGRGEITGCSDKRVSRKHSQISYISDNEIQVLALHTNPCFIMKKGSPPVEQFKKNEEKILTAGDYLGLLPDASWFEIVIKRENLTGQQNCSTVSFKPLINDSSPLKLSNDSASYSSKKKSPEENTVNEPCSSNNVKLPKTESGFENMSAISPELEKTKKLPLWMYEIDEPKEMKGNLSAKRLHSSSPDEDFQGKKAKVGESSSIDGQILRESVVNEIEPGEVTVKEETMEETPQRVEVKSEFGNQEDKNSGAENASENQSIPKSKELKHSGESSKKTNEKDGYESDVVEPNESNEASNPLRRRPICQYEASCYRKNPAHKQEYCHPGDSDYVRPENRPQCPYGAACYRQNQLHRIEYQHPTNTPAHRPQPQSPASPASSLPTKRKPKTTKTKITSSSDEEDDYDLEDPFINDASSDDYAPSESSSGEEEEEEGEEDHSSQNDKKNFKKLKKEAKKFIKGKKK